MATKTERRVKIIARYELKGYKDRTSFVTASSPRTALMSIAPATAQAVSTAIARASVVMGIATTPMRYADVKRSAKTRS